MPSTPQSRPPRRVLVTLGVIAAFLVVAGVVGATQSSDGGADRPARTFASQTRPAPAPLNAPELATSDSGSAAAKGSTGSPDGASAGTAAASKTAPVAGQVALATDAKVVKTGSVDLSVRTDQVAAVTDRAADVATANGGFVADRRTEGGPDHPAGSVTIRIPTEHFADAVAQVSRLGKVVDTRESGKDVTAEYVDVAARLHALQDTRQQFVTLLGKADNIQDILSVQDRMNSLQVEIEQLQGQQKLLDNQSTFATLAISVSDQDSVALRPDSSRTGFAKAVHDAGHGFTSATQRVVAGSGVAAFWLVVLLAVGLVARGVRRLVRRRQSARPSIPGPSTSGASTPDPSVA